MLCLVSNIPPHKASGAAGCVRRHWLPQPPGPGGAERPILFRTGAASTPRRFKKHRNASSLGKTSAVLLTQPNGEVPAGVPAGVFRMHQAGDGPVAVEALGFGDHSLSAMAAARGHSVVSRSEVSTVSPHCSAPPPATQQGRHTWHHLHL